jgi:hypothetical protein
MIGLVGWMALVSAVPQMTRADSPAPCPDIREMSVRGVYWPWERTKPVADRAGKDFWVFVEETMRRIREDLHCNVVWFVNGPDDPARVSEMASRYGLRVLYHASGIHHLSMAQSDALASLRAIAEGATRPFTNDSALLTYLLKDEPRTHEVQHVEAWYQAMRRADPARESIAVVMPQQAEVYALETSMPVLCVDIYHFGGAGSPFIPNPARRSQATYRDAVHAAVELGRAGRKAAWAMPQMFSEEWGPVAMDGDGNRVAEKGTYLHWRTPTPAEVRWQAWEAVRAGCRGVVFFALLPGYALESLDKEPDDDMGRFIHGRMNDGAARAAKERLPLLAERTTLDGSGWLLGFRGELTEQSKAMGEAYAQGSKAEAALTGSMIAPFPVVFAETPVSVSTLLQPSEPDVRYTIVVNDDLENEVEKPVYFAPNVAGVMEVGAETSLTVTASSRGALRKATLRLPPGGGMILRIEFAGDEPGLLLLEEGFELSQLKVGLEYAERVRERRAYGLGFASRVRAEIGNPDKTSKVVIPRLQGPASPLWSALGARAGEVYCMATGEFPGTESLVIAAVGKDGASKWLQAHDHGFPVVVPRDAESLEFLLRPDARLRDVRFWYVPSTRVK